MSAMRSAVVLLSGGLDSTTTLAIARAMGFEVFALSFDYGQRHNRELDLARRTAERMGVARHVVARLDAAMFAGSALTDDIPVPKNREPEQHGDGDEDGGIPATYVPARNTVFLAHALAWAETLGAFDLFLGVNALDYSGYPDCRPAFVEAFERLANLATRAGVQGQPIRVHAPLIHLTKAQIIQRGLELGVDYGLTTSCYDPDPADGAACGHCDACILRLRGFAEAGATDPILYRENVGQASLPAASPAPLPPASSLPGEDAPAS